MSTIPTLHDWIEFTSVGGARSRMVSSTWCYDKYPDLPELNAGKTVTLLDQDGPGVVSCLHLQLFRQANPGFETGFGPETGTARLV